MFVFVLGTICLLLAPITSLWWLVLLCGTAAPIVLAVLDGPSFMHKRPGERKDKERELLEALAEHGEITPTSAAMHTSLTVDEASKMLEELTSKGHLKPKVEGSIMAYALRERDRHKMPDKTGKSVPLEEKSEGDKAPQQPDEPLSERELEVLALIASGRTNSEIARSLFIAVGTVKSHTGNIYRKLDARNRAEALTRARERELLP